MLCVYAFTPCLVSFNFTYSHMTGWGGGGAAPQISGTQSQRWPHQGRWSGRMPSILYRCPRGWHGRGGAGRTSTVPEGNWPAAGMFFSLCWATGQGTALPILFSQATMKNCWIYGIRSTNRGQTITENTHNNNWASNYKPPARLLQIHCYLTTESSGRQGRDGGSHLNLLPSTSRTFLTRI